MTKKEAHTKTCLMLLAMVSIFLLGAVGTYFFPRVTGVILLVSVCLFCIWVIYLVLYSYNEGTSK